MNALPLETNHPVLDHPAISIRWQDADTGCTLLMASPAAEPELWSEYLAGAQRSYRKFGVEDALELDVIRYGDDTVLFFAAIDETGRMVGGVRAKGPLQSAEDSHAVVEWAGHPAQATVCKMINDRVPFGILEMKAAWVASAHSAGSGVAKALARTGFWAMAVLDFQFCMATSAAHVLERWSTSGGVVAPIPAASYPDERYRTKMMWWDRSTFSQHAEPEQLAKILSEMAYVADEAELTHPAPILAGAAR